MAELSLGESRWRILRRALRKPRFRFEDVRNWARHDKEHFAWLVREGFVAPLGGGLHRLTDRGKAASDLGMYEVDLAARPARGGGPSRPS